MMNNIRSYQASSPIIDSSCYIDPSAVVIGKVKIAKNSSLWCNVVVRGDVSHIDIGENTNIQDMSILHVTHYNPGISTEYPLIIGANVTIGHNCCIHACTIKDNVLIGMSTTILDGAIIEANILIGAGSFIPKGKHLISGYLYYGNPIRQIRELTVAEIEFLTYSAHHYVKLMQSYINNK